MPLRHKDTWAEKNHFLSILFVIVYIYAQLFQLILSVFFHRHFNRPLIEFKGKEIQALFYPEQSILYCGMNCRDRWMQTKMAQEEGFEPPTSRLTAGCSTTELLLNIKLSKS